jgi:hypothetical protein
MKLLRAAIDINQKKIVKQQILDKVILIKSFLVGNHKALKLEGSHLADQIRILARIIRYENVFKLLVIINFKELTSLQFLAVRW